jgi:hypothetical protein
MIKLMYTVSHVYVKHMRLDVANSKMLVDVFSISSLTRTVRVHHLYFTVLNCDLVLCLIP